GVKAIVGCPKGKYEDGKCTVGMQVQSFLFNKSKFTMEQAKAWLKSHEGDAMPLEEINIKIQELRDRRASIQKKIDAYYTVKQRDPEINRLYEEIRDIDAELAAWQEARVEKIIEKSKGEKMDQETKEEFMKKCVEGGKTEEECETLWTELQAGDAAIGMCVAKCIIRGNSLESCREKCKTQSDQPRTEAERAKTHFNISDEDWEALTEEEKQAYIAKLPERGSADQNQCICPECNHEFTSEEKCSEVTCPECAHVGCAILIEKTDTYQECG
ncbi:unnamed protein product, partial [marine sediment metagenome]